MHRRGVQGAGEEELHRQGLQFPVNYKNARDRLRKDIHLTTRDARKQHRHIRYHDIDTTRDVFIGVDRFFEKAHKMRLNVGIVDLMLLATAKYLTDFLGFSDRSLFVVTADGALYKLARALPDVPMTFNPLLARDAAAKVFVA